MTCIVGLVHEGKVWIGADSAGVKGWDLVLRADSKVFVKDGFGFGFTTSFRMGQLLQHAFTIPKRHPERDLTAYMCTDFVDAIRACLKSGGYAKCADAVETGGDFLVGHAGRLFSIESDYQVAESLAPYQAVGCGQSFALGALFATEGLEPRRRVQLALEAACAMSAGVRGPFRIETV